FFGIYTEKMSVNFGGHKFSNEIIDILTNICTKPVSSSEGDRGGIAAKYTHATYDGKKHTKWNVPSSKLGAFWRSYIDLVNEKSNLVFNLEEKTEESNPFIVDV